MPISLAHWHKAPYLSENIVKKKLRYFLHAYDTFLPRNYTKGIKVIQESLGFNVAIFSQVFIEFCLKSYFVTKTQIQKSNYYSICGSSNNGWIDYWVRPKVN